MIYCQYQTDFIYSYRIEINLWILMKIFKVQSIFRYSWSLIGSIGSGSGTYEE